MILDRWVGGWQAAFARVYGGGYLHGGVAAHALASIANRETVVQSGLSQDEYCKYGHLPILWSAVAKAT